jgi:predicted dehydrogenase
MEMPNGLKAECKTSYTDNLNYLKAEAADGFFELQPAFNYSGLKGKTTNGIIEYAPMSQQAKQMDEFALAIKNNRPTIVPGELGRRDVKIIAAIYEAMNSGKRVLIAKG